MVKIPLEWRVGHAAEKGREPDEFVGAEVPGAVQIDWAKAKNMPDWNRDVNFRQYKWMEDCFWIYRAHIPKTDICCDSRLLLRCRGIDYKYEVYLGDALVYAYEGMFRPFELDLSEAADAGGELSIVIYPIPKDPAGTPNTRQEAASSCKPPVSYSWDWHPRLVPSGIWDETELCVAPKERIARAEVLYTLSGDLRRADITVNAELIGCCDCGDDNCDGVDCGGNSDGGGPIQASPALRFRMCAPDGATVLDTTNLASPLSLADPVLWWCNGYGEPALYSWELLLEIDGRVIDRAEGKAGFRKISLEMNPGAWDEPAEFPKSRSHAPITVTLNNTPIFAKGTNWVNPEIFPGKMDAETYRPLLEYARDANMNLLRVWGGGIVNKDCFFDQCDALGLMVWQEFPLACNKYPDDDHYLATLESEARAIITRLRGRACLAIWCGGNELFNNWSLMTDQSLPLRLLNGLCYELDRGRPFLPTSPVIGMAHGCYLFVYPDGREVYEAMANAHYTAYTEFGVPSFSNLKTCLDATERENIYPLAKTDITVEHHVFNAWSSEHTWGSMDIIRGYFGEPDSLEQMIEWSQWLQCEGYKCIYEEARRQKPYCSMALNWCYNEPWPTLANNSLINYPSDPKPAYGAVAESCRNRLASARIAKFAWAPGEEFAADLFLLNDGTQPIDAGSAAVYIECGGERRFVLKWDYPGAPANQNLAGPTIRCRLPECAGGVFTELKLIIDAGCEMSSEYRLIMKV